jgi:P27 family predicted phage terminase small subunit
MPGAKGRSGRRPLPTKIKKLRGNPGKRALNDREPKVAAGIPIRPIGLQPLAIKEWRDIVPELEQLGILSKIDGKALAAYCSAFARWMQAEQEITARGIIVEEPILDREGNEVGTRIKRNPAVSISNEALKLMKSFLIEFGMTPASRSRIRVEKPDQPEDPLEALLKRHDVQTEIPTVQ